MVTTGPRAKTCYLHSKDKSLSNIYLPDCTPVTLGRSPETNIQDTKCSRKQVELEANYGDYYVIVHQIGERACGFNGFKTSKGLKFVAEHGDHLEILLGKYPYSIEFNPPPPKKDKKSKRRLHESPTLDKDIKETKRKMQKVDDAGSESESICTNGSKDKLSKEAVLGERDRTLSSVQKISESVGSTGFWENYDNGELLIFHAANVQSSSKIAAYDMDGTLIKTKSGLEIPKDYADWQLLCPQVPEKLKEFRASGYKIVIFTNQAKIGMKQMNIREFKIKIENILKKIGVPIQVFIATSRTIHRKPGIGMWQVLETHKNDGIAIDKESSFYVGDAAGREKNWAPGKKKDFSTADRLLALNLNLKFETPEEHFFKSRPVRYKLPAFNPKKLPKDIPLCDPPTDLTSTQQEMIIMVGGPASGKSHFVKNHLKLYERVNRDTLGSWQKCLKELEKYLSLKRSVVVDNTNGERDVRKRYLNMAKKYNIKARCFVMTTTLDHIFHNNKFRELTDPSHETVGNIIIHSYAKKYQPPSLEEGFTEIVKVNFIPQFDDEDHRRLYEMYLIER